MRRSLYLKRYWCLKIECAANLNTVRLSVLDQDRTGYTQLTVVQEENSTTGHKRILQKKRSCYCTYDQGKQKNEHKTALEMQRQYAHPAPMLCAHYFVGAPLQHLEVPSKTIIVSPHGRLVLPEPLATQLQMPSSKEQV